MNENQPDECIYPPCTFRHESGLCAVHGANVDRGILADFQIARAGFAAMPTPQTRVAFVNAREALIDHVDEVSGVEPPHVRFGRLARGEGVAKQEAS